jgi:hypothetical protein
MNTADMERQAIAWVGNGQVALVEDTVTRFGLHRRKYVHKYKGNLPVAAEHLTAVPEDALQVSTLPYFDEDGHGTLLVMFRVPALVTQ